MQKRLYKKPELATIASTAVTPVLLACTGQINCFDINNACPNPSCVPAGDEALCFDNC